MNLPQQFRSAVETYHLLQSQTHVLIAVSGGVDSVVLTELCHRAGLEFSIAHCNFQLRGEESERDEKFVRNLGEKYGTDVFVKKFDTKTYAEEHKISIQEAARELRYNYFRQLIKEQNFSFTLLAHHANDKIETVLMNFFRGTGLEGLTGMPEWNKEQANALRPLLHIKRKDIETFARENNLKWIEDSSNESSKYTRNFFRNELIPQLQKVFPQVEDNLLDNIERLEKTNALYRRLVSDLKEKIIVKKGYEFWLPFRKLYPYEDSSLMYEIIKDFGFGEKQVPDVRKLFDAESGKYVANEKFQIIKHRHWLVIAPVHVVSDTIAIEKDLDNIHFTKGILNLYRVNNDKFVLSKSKSVAQLDMNKIEWPLLLRKWRQGDYFFPLGMPKKKKLARFFIDQKLSKSDKENVWVLESNKKILWIVGHRIDDRFKITDKTKEVLQISVSSL